jgi:Na+/proline symporter
MMRVKSIWRTGKLAVVAMIGWLFLHGVALAQKGLPGPGQEATTGGGNSSYVLPYTIVTLFVALGIFVVCRPTRRRDRARPEEYTSIIDDGTLSED